MHILRHHPKRLVIELVDTLLQFQGCANGSYLIHSCFINIDNDVKRSIEKNGGTYGIEALTYYPLYDFNDRTQAMSINVVKLREAINVTA